MGQKQGDVLRPLPQCRQADPGLRGVEKLGHDPALRHQGLGVLPGRHDHLAAGRPVIPQVDAIGLHDLRQVMLEVQPELVDVFEDKRGALGQGDHPGEILAPPAYLAFMFCDVVVGKADVPDPAGHLSYGPPRDTFGCLPFMGGQPGKGFRLFRPFPPDIRVPPSAVVFHTPSGSSFKVPKFSEIPAHISNLSFFEF